MIDMPILIAGGGPVAVTLALELAHDGVRSILVERDHKTTRHPKMDFTNGRTMELFPRLNWSDRLRAAGVRESSPVDIMWATSPTGHLLHNIRYPSVAEKRAATEAANDGTGEPGAFASAAQQLGTPLQIVPVPDEPALRLLEYELLLVRPDQHVARRGNAPPADTKSLLRLVTGQIMGAEQLGLFGLVATQ
jgi:hypothetical protein